MHDRLSAKAYPSSSLDSHSTPAQLPRTWDTRYHACGASLTADTPFAAGCSDICECTINSLTTKLLFVMWLQYPLYSAALALYNGTLLPYYLDEQNQWALRLEECKSQVDKVGSI